MEAGSIIGIHLRPNDVQTGRIAIVRIDDGREIIEVTASLKQYVFRCVATLEGFVNEEGPLKEFDESLKQVNDIFGKDFYRVGSHGNFTEGEVDNLMLQFFGGSPYAFAMQAFFQDNPNEQVKVLNRPSVVNPGVFTCT